MTDLKNTLVLAKRNSPFRTLTRTAIFSTAVALGLSAVASDRVIDHANIADPSATSTGSSTKTSRWFQIGKASWYGFHFQGHKTANGETFDMNSLTCAHRSLPLGSWIRVTNLHNRKTIFVRVNDRGPMIDDRIIDLSYAAAHAVGLAGIGKVKLEPVRDGDQTMARALLAQLHMPISIMPPTN